MKKEKKEVTNFLFFFIPLFFALCSLSLVLSSCVRLTGSAGVWKQGAEEEASNSHQVGFDTNNAIPQSSKANIAQ